jgi:ADP-heptose:LPS heptosyltransferase
LTGMWSDVKKILCIRLDNLGDVLMSTPAIHALKETFNCEVTLLTSSMAAGVAPFIGADEIIISDVPWVKNEQDTGSKGYQDLIQQLNSEKFDAAVLFTVFSQNPMPAILLTYLAGIPKRLAYCRENPYSLLTDWFPDEEPYSTIKHQVIRDLELVAKVGAKTSDQKLRLFLPHTNPSTLFKKIKDTQLELNEPWVIIHPCASEEKRLFPIDRFRDIIEKIQEQNIQVVITGVNKDRPYIDQLISRLHKQVINLAGELSMVEFMELIRLSPLLLSVNTGPVHLAAALKKPVVVLYAWTNPQHTPWMTPNKVFNFPVNESLKSKNQVLTYLAEHLMEKNISWPSSNEVVTSINELMQTDFSLHPQLVQIH